MKKTIPAILLWLSVSMLFPAFALADVAINVEHFPDAVFRAYVADSFDNNNDGILSDDEISAVTEIDVYKMFVESLDGIEYFTSLVFLDCSSNPDLTRLPNLSLFPDLTKLYCEDCGLSGELHLGACPKLSVFSCCMNKLDTLDISGCPLLKWVFENFERRVKDWREEYLYYAHGDDDDYDHRLWYDIGVSVIACANEQDVAVDSARFPDDKFRAYVQERFDTNGDGRLSKAEISAVTVIDFFEEDIHGIASLQGIELFTGLKKLNCCDNDLCALDVSFNTALTELDCTFNQLTELDVSHNTGLIMLSCAYNSISALDVSCNAKLELLNCCANFVDKLDLSRNVKLKYLYCLDCPLKALDLSQNTTLVLLSCYNTGLTRLDISHNPDLKELYCYDTALTELDIRNCPELARCYREAKPVKDEWGIDGSVAYELDDDHCLAMGSAAANRVIDSDAAFLEVICPLVLPGHLVHIKSEAFSGVAARAFLLPAHIEYIASDAFPKDATLYYPVGSDTEAYCQANAKKLPSCMPGV